MAKSFLVWNMALPKTVLHKCFIFFVSNVVVIGKVNFGKILKFRNRTVLSKTPLSVNDKTQNEQRGFSFFLYFTILYWNTDENEGLLYIDITNLRTNFSTGKEETIFIAFKSRDQLSCWDSKPGRSSQLCICDLRFYRKSVQYKQA